MSDAIRPSAAQSAREDIAFMRALAEQGANHPILGGSALLATGLIYAAACLAAWWVMIDPPAQAGAWMVGIWVTAPVVQTLVVGGMALRFGRLAAPADRTNRLFARVWSGVGWAVVSCLASFFLTAWLAHKPDVFAGYPAIILALYGVGWTVTASGSRERWTWAVALLSYAFAVVSGAFAGSVHLPLLFALALVLLLAAPGAVLIRRARA